MKPYNLRATVVHAALQRYQAHLEGDAQAENAADRRLARYAEELAKTIPNFSTWIKETSKA